MSIFDLGLKIKRNYLSADIDRFKDILEIVKKMKLKILPKNPYDFVKETMVLPLLDEKIERR